MASILNVTELDFDQIKTNLKAYLKNQDGFTDYDFDGAGLNILLDVFATNTHYSALNAHYALNEAFLDSAQIRGNVVTRAKSLGYIPRSTLSPRATVSMTVNAASVASPPETLTLKRGSKFTSLVDNEEYTFVNLNETTVSLVSNKYVFTDVELIQGVIKKTEYTVNNIVPNQKFQLNDTDADTSTLIVKVKANDNAFNEETYSVYSDISKVYSDSKVYWLQQNANEYYEIYFGDGATGVKPVTGYVVTIEYIYGNGTDANGANLFTFAGSFEGVDGSTNSIITVSAAAAGQLKETLESIRFNAPLKFAAQNRAVTSDDYKAIIKSGFPNAGSIAVWGGELNNTPDFGNVYIAITPINNYILSDAEKTEIYDLLKTKTVATINPIILDQDPTYITIDVDVRYNPNLTGKTNAEIVTAITQTIADYSNETLSTFDGVFRHSQVTRIIDITDPSIISSTVRPTMYKSPFVYESDAIALSAGKSNSFILEYPAQFFQSKDPDDMIINSDTSPFTYDGQICYIGDTKIDGSTNTRNVVIYRKGSTSNLILKVVGELNFDKQTISLSGFTPDAGTGTGTYAGVSLNISVIPNSLDIAPSKNQLVGIVTKFSSFTATVDKIATSGQAGAISYTTTPRLK